MLVSILEYVNSCHLYILNSINWISLLMIHVPSGENHSLSLSLSQSSLEGFADFVVSWCEGVIMHKMHMSVSICMLVKWNSSCPKLNLTLRAPN